MSLTTKFHSKYHYLYLFIALGILLRVCGLFFFPSGMEGDEVVVVYWGRKWIQNGEWILLTSQDLPAWETPSAYFFGALDLMGINPRWGAVAISCLELWVCFLWTRRRAGQETALIATAFLALMPWHLFFSYVLGPCVAGIWTSLYLLDVKNIFGRMAINVGGLFYYVSFRVVMLWGGLKNLCTKQWRKLFLDIISGLVALGVLLLCGKGQFASFFNKGSYLVTQRGPFEWAHHYLNSVLLWWVPPLQVYWTAITEFSMDDVGFGFANTLGPLPPLSVGTSIFFGMGIFRMIKSKAHRDILGFFLLSLLLVGFTPSFVHFPFVLPVVAFIAAIAAQNLIMIKPRVKAVLIGSLVVSVLSCGYVIYNFGRSDRWQIFTDHVDAIPAELFSRTQNQSFIWVSGIDYFKARLAADKANVPIVPLPVSFAIGLADIRINLQREKSHWVFVQTTAKKLPHPRPEKELLLQKARGEYLDFLERFELNMQIKERYNIVIDGTEMGTLYELVH